QPGVVFLDAREDSQLICPLVFRSWGHTWQTGRRSLWPGCWSSIIGDLSRRLDMNSSVLIRGIYFGARN
ncbi:MAG: hypothetical protein ACE5NC_07380, partial [Anaerolineae bacterium]